MLLRSPLRREVKLSSEPSGDQTGPDASRVGSVKRVGAPSGVPFFSRCTQISRWRRFSFSTIVVTVNATMSLLATSRLRMSTSGLIVVRAWF
ncbi:hypothetical protein D3C83_61310 [compost metagenome]